MKMSVYVDDLRPALWKYKQSCHLAANSSEELHNFATILGLKKSWFQNGSRPHYDLSSRKRTEAIRAGAIQISRRQMVRLLVEEIV